MLADRFFAGLCVLGLACTPEGLVRGAAPLAVGRGAIEERVLLTGEIDAAVATMIDAPRTDDGGVTIRWIAEDGAHVRAGDRVVELDNAALIDKIREAELAMVEAAIAYTQQEAETDVAVADKRFDVVKQESALAKAQLDMTIPPDLVSRREAKTFEVSASRAKVELANAEGTLRS